MMHTHPAGWIDNVVLHGMLKNGNTFEVVNVLASRINSMSTKIIYNCGIHNIHVTHE
jgi:hypothetical protein